MSYFADLAPVRFEGPQSENPLAYRWYDKDRLVLGRRMEDQLRFAVCFWHTFCWNGFDPFGYDGTLERPWQQTGDSMLQAKDKAAAAFDLFKLLDIPFYTFHDRDVAPEGSTNRESVDNLKMMVDVLAAHQERTGMRLLWGTANLFSHRRYMSGAATNPDPEVFAMAALQVREAMDATKKLGGANYVMWGGREGYETLLNTDMKRELAQMARFLHMAVEYKYKIGLSGPILIEPKPREPTKHQYDFDVATVFGFLAANGLDNEVKVNIEANHATLAGHSFEHEIATAQALGIFGSIDANRGDMQCGWDTDQFPNAPGDNVLALYHVMQGGGFASGGMNFDAKVRRQSLDPVDLLHGHAGAIDTCARALLGAEKLITDDRLAAQVRARYQGWDGELGKKILAKQVTLDQLADQVLQRSIDVLPQSGRQEALENLVQRAC